MSRIAAAAVFVVLVAAGCGGATPSRKSAAHGVPSALAQDWAGQASAIAAAAAAGNDCHAQALALSLRSQVMRKEHLLPLRLRSPLVTGLDSLVERTACRVTVPATTAAAPPQPRPHEPKRHGPKPPEKHGPQHRPPPHDHGHGHGGDG